MAVVRPAQIFRSKLVTRDDREASPFLHSAKLCCQKLHDISTLLIAAVSLLLTPRLIVIHDRTRETTYVVFCGGRIAASNVQ